MKVHGLVTQTSTVHVKFQESYLERLVVLLKCNLTEGAVISSRYPDDKPLKSAPREEQEATEMEEGELADTQGRFLSLKMFVRAQMTSLKVTNVARSLR